MRVDAYKDALLFCESLMLAGPHEVVCNGRLTRYFCGPQALGDFRSQRNGDMLVLVAGEDEYSSERSKPVRQVLSIGRCVLHDEARRFAHRAGCSYATCPVPLTNDCFATDRSGGSPSRSAVRMDFPSDVILDWGLCAELGLDTNRFGLGEVLGLVASVRDFSRVSHSQEIAELAPEIDAAVESLFARWCDPQGAPEPKIAALGAYLSLKGLMIQMAGTNDIVAGCDHMLGYELSKRGLRWPHGKLVAAGVLFALPLFRDVPDEHVGRIAGLCLSSGLLSVADLRVIAQMGVGSVLRNAPFTRPERKTVLCHLKPADEERVVRSFNVAASENG